MSGAVPPTVRSGSRDTLNVLQDGRVPDREREVFDLDPNTAPLLAFTSKLSKRVAMNPKFDWFEDEAHPYWSMVDGAIADTTTTAIAVEADHGVYFQAGNLVLIPRSGEIIRVRSVATDTLTVTRGAAGSTAANISDNDDLRIIGDAFAEGSGGATSKSTLKVMQYNYTQIFKTAYGATGTDEASEMYWGNDRASEAADHEIDHSLKLESAFLWSQRSEGADPDTGKPLRTMRGLINWISTNTTAINGFLTMDLLDTFISEGFRYSSRAGKTRKWLFTSRLVTNAVNQFARDRLNTVPKDKTMGVQTAQYQTNLGEVLLINHNLLENNPVTGGLGSAVYGGYAVMVDPASPRYRFLKGRDTQVKKDIQDNDADEWKDQVWGEVGLQCYQEGWNSIATGITG